MGTARTQQGHGGRYGDNRDIVGAQQGHGEAHMGTTGVWGGHRRDVVTRGDSRDVGAPLADSRDVGGGTAGT